MFPHRKTIEQMAIRVFGSVLNRGCADARLGFQNTYLPTTKSIYSINSMEANDLLKQFVSKLTSS